MAVPPATPTWPLVRAQMLRGAGFVALLCLAIALLLTATERGAFAGNLLHASTIGLLCWLIIDGGRHLVSLLRTRRRLRRGLPSDLPVGFPGWPWMVALLLAGMTLGPIVGTSVLIRLGANATPLLGEAGSGSTRTTWTITLLASVASVVTLTLLERLSHARAEAEAARRAAAENQLKLLESQLEPHMLFNTLANLRVLIALDPPRAQAMLDRLIAFLRATLGASRSSLHPLATEFERIADYLALMQVRMGARVHIADCVAAIERKGNGVILFLPGHPDPETDLAFYLDEPIARPPEEPGVVLREYGFGAQVLSDLGLERLLLLTNRPRRIPSLDAYGLTVVDQLMVAPGGELSSESELRRDES